MSALEELSPEELDDVIGEYVLEAEEAREDPSRFFNFVMRDETKNEPIAIAPHQELKLEFMRAHRRFVVLEPVGFAKTYSATGLILWMMGRDALMRGAIVSAAQAQSEKPLQLARQYIETSPEVRVVFPELRRSTRDGDRWTTTALTVERPPGIRDPTLIARGLDSKAILGSRWKVLIGDDIHNQENTSTPEQREKVWEFWWKSCMTRMDPSTGVAGWQCTAWHPEDVTHRLMESKDKGGTGWPALIMDAEGIIKIRNTSWDTPLIRPADDLPADHPDATYRLVAHDPDPESEIPLWPERWSSEALQDEREDLGLAAYNQIFKNICRDDSTSLCKQADIEKALGLARRLTSERIIDCSKLYSTGQPPWSSLIFTGVDLAFSQSDAADECAIFTIAIFKYEGVPLRVPIMAECGKWGTTELYERIVRNNDTYRPAGIGFENNAAQEGIRQLFASSDRTLPLKPHRTDATKNSILFGIPSIFAEFSTGCWAIPNINGRMAPLIEKWVKQCLNYVPSAHTGDELMASYFARDLAKKYGALARERKGRNNTGRSIAARIAAR